MRKIVHWLQISILTALLLGSTLALADALPNNLLGAGSADVPANTTTTITTMLASPVTLVAGQEYWIGAYAPQNVSYSNLYFQQNGNQSQNFASYNSSTGAWGPNWWGPTANPPVIEALDAYGNTIYTNMPGTGNYFQFNGGEATAFIAPSNASVSEIGVVISSGDPSVDYVTLGLFDSTNPVPEPSSLLLVVPGLGMFLKQRWQMRKRA
jgi:hypothetical protein